MYHQPVLSFQGQTYTLGHLFSCDIKFDLGEHGEVTAFCVFSNHCYTEELKASDLREGKLILLDHNNNERYFCPARYSLSLKLKSFMASWGEKKSFPSGNGRRLNWLMVEHHDSNGVKQAIKIAYSIKSHSKGKATIHIETMHPYDRSTPPAKNAKGWTRFGLILKKVAAGEAQPRPRR